jgi:hypothetical protein
MAEGSMKFPGDPATLVSAAELAKVIGTDLETINNWLRRGIITRARIGGRHLRTRLFSMEEVYKTALKNELVKIGNPSVLRERNRQRTVGEMGQEGGGGTENLRGAGAE